MCGITGFVARSGAKGLPSQLEAMNGALAHRGPDGEGLWFETDHSVGLGHRRLAIVELSELGRQPMTSASGRYVITYNGEIYNFQEIRAELESQHAFRGRSDTEVMLAAFERWGVERALHRFVGMFAFALWDREARCLYLARDRLGKKPLYYGEVGDTFVFGSELKALRSFAGGAWNVDRDALASFLRFSYIPAPNTIYQGIRKLPAGGFLKLDVAPHRFSTHVHSWWSALQTLPAPFTGSLQEAEMHLAELLEEAVRIRMISDVPLGAFLSGGVDSTLVVALMKRVSDARVRTFTIGFREQGYDEAQHARQVAQYLGTDHTELYLDSGQAIDVIPKLPSIYDEPFADVSQIPTYLVSALARQHVTVALSGDGGDEMFGGYSRYLWWRRIWPFLRLSPRWARRAAADAIARVPTATWDRVMNSIMPYLPGSLRFTMPGQKLEKLGQMLLIRSQGELYRRLVSHWPNAGNVVVGGSVPLSVMDAEGAALSRDDFTAQMMKLDILTYLPDDILVKVDRASMSVSLEARAPLLDHRVAEFALSLPTKWKIADGQGKWLLRRELARHVPRELFERPKMGFGVPMDSWLRNELRDWAEDLLSERRLRTEGFFDPAEIRSKWSEHLDGKRQWQYLLWDVLMFQAWFQQSQAPRQQERCAA